MKAATYRLCCASGVLGNLSNFVHQSWVWRPKKCDTHIFGHAWAHGALWGRKLQLAMESHEPHAGGFKDGAEVQETNPMEDVYHGFCIPPSP